MTYNHFFSAKAGKAHVMDQGTPGEEPCCSGREESAVRNGFPINEHYCEPFCSRGASRIDLHLHITR